MKSFFKLSDVLLFFLALAMLFASPYLVAQSVQEAKRSPNHQKISYWQVIHQFQQEESKKEAIQQYIYRLYTKIIVL